MQREFTPSNKTTRSSAQMRRLGRWLSIFMLVSLLMSMFAPVVEAAPALTANGGSAQAQGTTSQQTTAQEVPSPTVEPATPEEPSPTVEHVAPENPEQAATTVADEQVVPAEQTIISEAQTPVMVPCVITTAPNRVFLPLVIKASGGTPPPTNSPPTVTPCAISLTAGTTVAVDLLSIASDADGDALAFTMQAAPSNGTASMVGAVVSYTPAAFYVGPDRLQFMVADGRGGLTVGTITVTVEQSGATATPTATTAVATATQTQQATTLPTDVPTATQTEQATTLPTDVPTATQTAEATTLPTELPTATTESTVAPTATSTPEPTTTSAPTETQTATTEPTNTPTQTATTETTATSTATQVAIVTETATATQTATATGEATQTATATGTATATATATTTTPSNQVPVAKDLNRTILLTETTTFDLGALTSDPDSDPLTYSVVTTPTHGVVTLTNSTLFYSPTDTFTETDQLVYGVGDSRGGVAQGMIRVTSRLGQLHIVPGGVMFTAPAQSRLLSVKAYDGFGNEIPPAGLNLVWASINPAVVSVTPTGGGDNTATVTSAADVGSTFVTVRSQTDPLMALAFSGVMVAHTQPNVEFMTDDRVLFPDPNPLPDGVPSPALPRDASGNALIGSFTTTELGAAAEVAGDYRVDEVTSTKVPVVIRGGAPAINSLVLIGESVPTYGRVVAATERNGFSLLQVELVPIEAIFEDVDLDFSQIPVLDAKPITLEELRGEDAQNIAPPTDPSLTPGERRAEGMNSATPTEPPPFLPSNCKPETSNTLISIKLGSIKVNMDPKLEGKLVLTDGSVRHAELRMGQKFTVDLAIVNINLQPGVQGQITCTLATPKAFTLPDKGGWVVVVKALLGPEITLGPEFTVSVKIEGLFRIGVNPSVTLGFDTEFGFLYQNPTGVDGAGTFEKIQETKKILDPKAGLNYPQDIHSLASLKLEVKAGVYLVARGNFVFGGIIFEKLKELAEETNDPDLLAKVIEQKAKLTLDVANVKFGPELKVVWANAQQTLQEGKTLGEWTLQGVFSAKVESKALATALKKFGLNRTLDITLLEVNFIGWSLFDKLEKGTNKVLPEGAVKADQDVQFEVQPKGPDVRNILYGEVFYEGKELTELQVDESNPLADKLVGTWTVTPEICDASAAASDGYVELTVLGYSLMPNKAVPVFIDGIPEIRFPPIAPVANHLGTIKLTCEELHVRIEPPTPIYKGCYDQNGDGRITLGFTVIARDELAKLRDIRITTVSPYGKRLSQFYVDGKPGEKELSQAYKVSLAYDPSKGNGGEGTIEAVVVGLNQYGDPVRHKTANQRFSIAWESCGDQVTETEYRTVIKRCFTIVQARERQGERKTNPQTGEVTLEWQPWGAWANYGDAIPRGNCSFRVSRDPHVQTPDGLEFDSFSLGEFTYLQPQPDREGITLQVRQERVGQFNGGEGTFFQPWTSWNTAMAIKADDTIFEFGVDHLMDPLINGERQTLLPGLHEFGDVDLKVNSPTSVELSYKGSRIGIDQINQIGKFLDLRASVPQDGSMVGLLGTPNEDAADDFRLPDGSPARDAADLANGWRITDRTQSLFTYANGEGPAAYNKPQINEPPSREELAPYTEQATQLLQGTCRADQIDAVAVQNTALELYIGHTPEELAQAGLCWYVVHGKVTNSFVPDLPVPGAKVTITSPNLAPCETYTDRFGMYTCALPSLGSAPQLTIQVSGRGQAQTTTTFDALPPMNGTLDQEQNLTVAPTTLQMVGIVTDQRNDPLYNAQLRIKGPDGAGFVRAYTEATATGAYTTYIMLNDGVLGGQTQYFVTYSPSWSTEPNAKGIDRSFTRTLPQLEEHALNTVNEDLVLTGSLVQFSGRVSYKSDPSKTIPGVWVRVTPVTPVGDWTGCDVQSRVFRKPVRNPATETEDTTKIGTYLCEVQIAHTAPFSVSIAIDGLAEPILATVDPQSRAVGETIPVNVDYAIDSTILHVTGKVLSAGQPVVGALVTILADGALTTNKAEVWSGADGSYEATFALADGVTSGNLRYSLRYRDITVDPYGTVRYEQLQGAQVIESNHDLTVTGRKLRFSGRVTNRNADGAQLDGTVAINSLQLGPLCTAALGPDNLYSCDVLVQSPTLTTTEIEYIVSGTWGTASIMRQTVSMPALAETRYIARDFEVAATTLRLTGVVRNAAGGPLAGATVNAQGASTAETKTLADGSYTLFMVLPAGTLEGDITYRVSYRQSSTGATKHFNAQAGALNEVTQDFSYSLGLTYLRGTVRNPYNIPMPFTRIEISAPALNEACSTQTLADGSYFCALETKATAPFAAIYKASGPWGSQEWTEQVAAQPDQDVVEHVRDLLVNPTALHLTGIVADPSGGPISDVELTVTGQAAYQEAKAKTDSDGRYDFYVILKPGSTDVFSGTLSYNVGYGTATRLRNVAFTAQRNGLTPLAQNFALDTRVVQFRGNVINSVLETVPGADAKLVGTRVIITSPQRGKLCEWSSLKRYDYTTYECDGQVLSADPFEIEYQLTGAWGSATITDTVTGVPAPGQRITWQRDLKIVASAVAFTGTALDRDGKPLSSVQLTLTSPAFYNGKPLTVYTNGQGVYAGYAVLRPDTTTVAVDYLVTATNEAPLRRSAVVTPTMNGVATHAENWQFPGRKLVLQGKLTNQTDPTLPLGGQLLIVAPDLDQQLCQTTLYGVNGQASTYRCETLVRTDDSIKLNYRITGPWGTLTAVNIEVPAQATEFVHDFASAPRLLRFAGQVKNAAGQPLAGATVKIGSYSIVPGQYTGLGGMTNGSGSYGGVAVVGDGAVRGEVRYEIAFNGLTTTKETAFTFAEGSKELTLTEDFNLDGRIMEFRGNLVNTLTGGQGNLGQTRLVISSPTLGQLCELYTNGTSYSCSVKLPATTPFDVRYAFSGQWGVAEVTANVTDLSPSGGRGTYVQDLAYTPTMLRVSGQVQETDGSPLAGVAVMPSHGGIAAIWDGQGMTSGEDGSYSFLVVLKQIAQTQNGSLSLHATYGNTTQTRDVSYSANEGTINSGNAAPFRFLFAERYITVRGTLVNTLAPQAGAVEADSIIVSSPQFGQLCEGRGTTSYQCSLTVVTTDPVEVVINATGSWGTSEQRVQITEIPAVGASTAIVRDIEVAPTTVHLQGTLKTPAGQPVAGAKLRVTSSFLDVIVGTIPQVTTDNNGVYHIYFLLRDSVYNGTLRYQFEVDEMKTAFTLNSFNARKGQLNVRQEHLTFDQRRVRFTGKVTNQWVAGQGVPGQVRLTSPDFFSNYYCTAEIKPDGSYQCDALVRSATPFSVTYRVQGGWGALDVPNVAITGIPDVAGSVIVERNVAVAPTTLHLQGTLTDSFGQRLKQAQVRITSDAFAWAETSGVAPRQTVMVRTDDNGVYNVDAMLNRDLVAGDLAYDIRYYAARLQQTRNFFGLQPNVVNQVVQNFEIRNREQILNGRVRHRAFPELGLNGRVTITSPTEGDLCSVQTSNGDFACNLAAVTTDPFSVTYTVAGDWGSYSYVDTVPLGVAGRDPQQFPHTRILEPLPTTLTLHGTLSDQQGAGMSGVTITVGGKALSTVNGADVSMETNNSGGYAKTVVLKANELEGKLVYGIRRNNTQVVETVPFVAQANTVNDLLKDVQFRARIVEFKGVVRNTIVPGTVVKGAQVAVRLPGIDQQLCADTGDDTGAYSCELQVLNADSFAVEYVVSGPWGNAVIPGTVPAGTVGVTAPVLKDLPVSPTTLRLKGIVTDATGLPLADATVQLSSNNFVSNAVVQTNESGVYSAYIVARQGNAVGSVEYRIAKGGTQIVNTIQQRWTRNTLTNLTADFTLAQRNYGFNGDVRNALAPAMTIGGGTTKVVITSPQLGEVCNVGVSTTGAYNCTKQLQVTQPFSVEYRLEGDWGSQIVTDTVTTLLPVGGTHNIARQFTPAPATLLISGTVEDAAHNLLNEARVSVAGPAISNISRLGYVTTDSDGHYQMLVALTQGTTAGEIALTVVYNNVTSTAKQSFTAEAGKLVKLVQDFTVAERRLQFGGAVRNGFVPGADVPVTTVEVLGPEGKLCTWPINGNSYGVTTYGCTAAMASTVAFTPTYVVTGTWGTQVVTGTPVINFPPVGQTLEVKQDLVVKPTTLYLHGVVKGGDNQPIANAWVEAKDSAESYVVRGSDRTDSTGAYSITLVLAQDELVGMLQLLVKADGGQAIEPVVYTATVNQRTDVEKLLTLGEREVQFLGSVVNSLLLDTGTEHRVPSNRVTVSSPLFGTLCTDDTAQDGDGASYNCRRVITTTSAFSVTYLVEGDWGSAEVTGNVPAAGFGTFNYVPFNPAVVAPTLRLTGYVRDEQGAALHSARVEVRGGALNYNQNGSPSGLTNEDGRYDFYVTAKQGLSTGNFTYTVRYDRTIFAGPSLEYPGTFTAAAASISAVDKNLMFNAQQLDFFGYARNAYTDEVLAYTDVTVSSAAGTLCTGTPNPGYNGRYICNAQITTTNAVPITYTLAGEWGTRTFSGQIPAGDVGTRNNVSKTGDFPIQVTTLYVSGLVTGTNGANLANAFVRVDSDQVISRAGFYGPVTRQERRTDTAGGYDTSFVLKAGVVTGTLEFTVNYGGTVDGYGYISGGITVQRTVPFTVTPNVENDATQNFTIGGELVFRGDLVNKWDATSLVTATTVVVTSPTLGELCTWTPMGDAKRYNCVTQLTNGSTQPFSVTYTITSQWGTDVIGPVAVAERPGVGQRVQVVRNLDVTTTSLRITGRVTDGTGKGVGGAYVRIWSPDNNPFANTTGVLKWSHGVGSEDEIGIYSVVEPLKAGVLEGTLHYEISIYGRNPITGTFTWGLATVGQLNDEEQNYSFTERRVQFYGYVTNGYAPSAKIDADQVAVYQGHTPLCQWQRDDWDHYICDSVVTATGPFSVTYVVTGTWGTDVVTTTAPLVPPDGELHVFSYDIPVESATLDLKVIVTDGQQGLEGATLYMGNQDVFSGNGSTRYADTDADGVAHVYATLKQGASELSIPYYVHYKDVEYSGVATFTVVPGQLTVVSNSVVVSDRAFVFQGALSNRLVQDTEVPVPATEYAVRSPQHGLLCNGTFSGEGTYLYCGSQLDTTTPFSVTYIITGTWGTETLSGTVDPAGVALGETVSVERDLELAPTTVKLHGTVNGPDNTPLPYGSVIVQSPLLVCAISWLCNGGEGTTYSQVVDGTYMMYGIVKAGVSSGTLTHTLAYGGSMQGETVTVNNLVPNALNDVAGGLWTFRNRHVSFYGAINAGNADNVPVYTDQIVISGAGVGTLCTLQGSSLNCTAEVAVTDAFSVTYTLTGGWGTKVVTATVEAGEVGSSTELSLEILVTPTILHITGTITTPEGEPVTDPAIKITGSDVLHPDGMWTWLNSVGEYEAYVPIRNVANGTLTVTVGEQETTKAFTALVGEVNEVEHDIEYDGE